MAVATVPMACPPDCAFIQLEKRRAARIRSAGCVHLPRLVADRKDLIFPRNAKNERDRIPI